MTQTGDTPRSIPEGRKKNGPEIRPVRENRIENFGVDAVCL
jgi:hypothetical protein